MLTFRDWLQQLESSPTTRALNQPWAYPALYVGGNPFSNYYSPKMLANYDSMIARDTKKKKKKKKKKHESVAEGRLTHPVDKRIDSFVNEIELLKKDVQDLTRLGKQSPSTKTQPQKPKQEKTSDELIDLAKKVLLNLRRAPAFYQHRKNVDLLVGKDAVRSRRVSRVDAKEIADRLGIDFTKTRFTAEAFRKGIEEELHTRTAPTSPDVADDRSDQRS